MASLSARSILRSILVLSLAWPSFPADRVWKKLRYHGGTIDAKVNPFDWNTTLTLSDNGLELNFAGRKRARIPATDVTQLSYGAAAHRRIAEHGAVDRAPQPIALFGILRSSRGRLIGLEWKKPGDPPEAVLLEVHKSDSRELLHELQRITGKSIENWP